MVDTDELALEELKNLSVNIGGNILPLNSVYEILIKKKICKSAFSVKNLLERLTTKEKIRSKLSGVSIELIDDKHG